MSGPPAAVGRLHIDQIVHRAVGAILFQGRVIDPR